MIGRHQHQCLVALLATAGLVGCHVRPEEPTEPLIALLPTPGIHFDTVESDSGTIEVLFRSGPEAPAVARLTGVHLTLDRHDTPLLLPFQFMARDEQDQVLELTCGLPPDTVDLTRALLVNHDIRVRISQNGSAQAEVELRDRVALRSGIHALTLEYEFLPAGPPDEIFAPYSNLGSEGLIGDVAFTTPVTLLRRGQLGLAILPDLSDLISNRRLPHALTITTEPQPTIRYGLINYSVLADPAGTVFTSTTARPTQVRGETLSFRHSVRVFDDARSRVTATQLNAEAWRLHAADSFRRSAHPLRDRTTTNLIFEALNATLEQGPSAQPFETTRQATRTAAGLAIATALKLADWQTEAEQLVDKLLASHNQRTLFPTSSALTIADELQQPDDATHAAITGIWLLQVTPHLDSARRQDAQRRCDDLAKWFRANQVENGYIPTRYHREFGQPRPGPNADTSFPALFLAEHGIQRSNSASLDAADKAVRFLEAILTSPRSKDETTTRLLPVICAAAAAIRLAEVRHLAYAEALATRLLEDIFTSQHVWSPNWLDQDLQYGFRDTDQSIRGNDPIGAFAGATLVDGYRLTGRKDFLQRGIQALRAGLVNESGVWTPSGLEAETPHWGRSCSAVQLLRIQSELGQGVVDVSGAFAEGVDALWFEDMTVDDSRIAFRLLTHATFDQTPKIRFHNLPERIELYRLVVNEHLVGEFDRETLRRGLQLSPQRVGLLRFQPPPYVRTNHEWLPRAIVDIPTDPSAEVFVELHKPAGSIHRVWLSPREDDEPHPPAAVAADRILEPSAEQRSRSLILGPREGEYFDCRLVWKVGSRTVRIPAEGYYRIEARATDCVDLGDGDELELTDAGNSTVVRFATGQESARTLTRTLVEDECALTCSLPIDADATAVTIRIHATGKLIVRVGPQQNEVHRSMSVAASVNTVTVDLTDSRLWRQGHLDVTVSPVDTGKDGTIDIARIDFVATGQATRSTPESARIYENDPPPRIRVLVVPLALADTPIRSDRAMLEQTFFGGQEYRRTPPPESQLTQGSVAMLVKEMSGGLTELTGTVTATIAIDSLAAKLRDQPDKNIREVTSSVLKHLNRHTNIDPTAFDVIVAVYSGTSLQVDFDGHSHATTFGQSFVFLPETAADGSYLSSGTALLALLRDKYLLTDYASPEMGNFGSLALSATGGGHSPPDLLGLNRQRLGWVDRVTLAEEHRLDGPVRFMLPIADRSIYELPFTDLPGRGRLIFEVRRIGSEGFALQGAGALAYWLFDPKAKPLTITADGTRCSSVIQRLSAQMSALETPFTGGTKDDLITEAMRLDDTSSPSLATPEGEILWTMLNFESSTEGVSFGLKREARNLLALTPTWLTGRNEKHYLLTVDGTDRGLGTVREDSAGLVLQTGSVQNWQLRANYALAASPRPLRLFLRFESQLSDPSPWLSVRLDGHERLFGALQKNGMSWFQVDFPALPRGGKLDLVLTNRADHATTVRLTRALLVPLSQRPHRERLQPDITSARLMDGITYGGVTRLSTGESGHATWTLPTVLAKGRSALLLRAGFARAETGGPVRIRATAHTPDGRWSADILDIVIDPADKNTPPVTLVRAEIGDIPEKLTAFLEVTIDGAKDQSVFVVSLAIARH